MLHKCLSPYTKAYLWNTICSPSLIHGMDCIYLTDNNLYELNSFQGRCMKSALNLGRRSHHSDLLKALEIKPMSEKISNNVCSLFFRICQTDTPARDIVFYMISDFVLRGNLIPGSLVHRLVTLGISPISAAFSKMSIDYPSERNGVVDSIRNILCDDNFTKPYNSKEQDLLRLLTRSF